MENIDDKLDNLVNKLRQQKPELHNAELFTDSIMKEVMNKSHRTTPKFLIFVRAVTSSAAVLLLGLFLFQQNDIELIASKNKPIPIFENKINIDSLCIQRQSNNKVNLIETYLCYMQQNSIKNKQLKSYIIQNN